MSEALAWYVARASGIVAWVMLALAVTYGLLLATRVLSGKPKPPWLVDIHRFLGSGAIVFTAIHVIALIADNTVSFTLVDVFVPFTSQWRPVAVAWGVVALYLLLTIQITSIFMKRIPNAVWKRIHRLSAILFIVATVHGLSAGTDAGPIMFWTVVAVGLLVLFLWIYRILTPRGKRPPARPAETPAPPSPSRAAD